MTDETSGQSTGLNAAIAAVLRAEKAALDLTNAQVAERSGLSEVSVQRYLRAKRVIDVEVLEALSGAVGSTAIEVMTAASARRARDVSAAATTGPVEPGDLEDQ